MFTENKEVAQIFAQQSEQRITRWFDHKKNLTMECVKKVVCARSQKTSLERTSVKTIRLYTPNFFAMGGTKEKNNVYSLVTTRFSYMFCYRHRRTILGNPDFQPILAAQYLIIQNPATWSQKFVRKWSQLYWVL